MAYQVAIDRTRRLVTIRYWGTITRTDFDLVRVALEHDPIFDPSFDAITDLRDADLRQLTTADIESVARRSMLQPTARRAIIADRDDHFGLARMYSTMRQIAEGHETTRVFRTVEEAAQWPGLDGSDPASFIAR